MKNRLIIFLFSAFLTSIYADDSSFFDRERFYIEGSFGLGFGKNYVDRNDYYSKTISYSESSDLEYNYFASDISYSIGYVYDNNNRLQFSHSKYSYENEYGSKANYEGYDIDGIVVLGDPDVKVGDTRYYYSLGLGLYRGTFSYFHYNDNEYYYNIYADSYNEEVQGVSGSFGIGLYYKLMKNIELDLGYSMKYIYWHYYDETDWDSAFSETKTVEYLLSSSLINSLKFSLRFIF